MRPRLYRKATALAAVGTYVRGSAVALLLGVWGAPVAADLWRVDQTITDRSDIIGDVVRLPVGDSAVVGIHRAAQRNETRGAALILHPPGSSLDDPAIVRPLRLGLADAGWETLAVQLPSKLRSESAAQWLARHGQLEPTLAGASQWLQQRGQRNQVIIGVGVSGWAALAYAAEASDTIRAVLLVSMPMPPESDLNRHLSASKIPVLDLFAERDRTPVLESRSLKRQLSQQNARYSQRVVPAARPGFPGVELNMVSMVRAWLAANAVGTESMDIGADRQ